MTPSNIPLADEFTTDTWANYMTFDPGTEPWLKFQKHADLRTFTPDSGEAWEGGTYGYLAGYEKFPGIEAEVKNEVLTTLTSKTPEHPVSLAEFAPTDFITFAMPSFPLAKVNITQSYLDITSDEHANFLNTEKTATVRFRDSTVALIEGNAQFRVPISAFTAPTLDLDAITGVRFRIYGREGEGTVTIMALRAIAASGENIEANPGWALANIDFDNWNGRLRKTISLNGDTTAARKTQGAIWRAAPLSGNNDPRPVDVEFGILFNTGSQEKVNRFTFFAREESEIFQNQLDLTSVTQAELDGHPQPDLGIKEFLPREIREFEGETMEEFDKGQTMEDLERKAVPNPTEESWVYFELGWGKGIPFLIMANSTTPGFEFPGLKGATLRNHAEYLLVCSLEGSSARARIYELNEDKSVMQTPIFDSTLIDEDNVFRRRKGRIGWLSTLGDNDSFVGPLRPRGMSFAEYRSFPLVSHTPVDGAQLFASFTGNNQLWDKETEGFTDFPSSTNVLQSNVVFVTRDKSRTFEQGGESWRVVTKGVPNVGIESNYLNFTDFTQMQIQFALWYQGPAREREEIEVVHPPLFPSSKVFPSTKTLPSHGYTNFEEFQRNSIVASLVSKEGTVTPLTMPELETNQWQVITLEIPPGEVIQTGPHKLRIEQATKIPTTWWVDHVSVFQRAVEWSARSVVDDPWMSNFAPWTDFRDVVNNQKAGIVLAPRGKDLQVRARALQQNVRIQKVELIPRYADLGRLVWPEDKFKGTSPTALFSVTRKNKTVTLTDESTKGSGEIVLREWSFGDGQRLAGNSLVVTHEYAEEGTYTVTLLVMNRNGLATSHEVEVNIP